MSKIVKEANLLEKAHSSGGLIKFVTYTKISGPGIWLALAALSAGSLVGSLGLGQRLGTEGLWVQAWAMLLGVFSLWAVSHITLNTQQSLFSLLRDEWNPSLAWWLAGSAMITNFAWCMPQFRFGAEITSSVLLPILDNKAGKVSVAFCMLALSIFLSFWYERSGFQSRLFQWVLRLILWTLCICLIVCVFLTFPKSGISTGKILSGFLPDTEQFSEIATLYQPLLEKAGEYRFFWEEKLLSRQKEVSLVTFCSTLGINLLFALPLLLLGRGWRRRHNGFAQFNLFFGLFIPFLICSSCLTILSAIAHRELILPNTSSGISIEQFTEEQKTDSFHNLLAERIVLEVGNEKFQELPPFQQEEKMGSLSEHERKLALLVQPTDTHKWISLLSNKEPNSTKYLLGFSVLLIAFSTILVLMVLNGHLVCEVLGKPHKGAPFQSGSLLLALSSVGPFVWSDQDSWVADPSYFLSLAILPYALLSFLVMVNSKGLLGRQCVKGITGMITNTGACLAFLSLGSCSFYLVWNHFWGNFPVGQILIILIGILLIIGYFSLQNKKLSSRLSGIEARLENFDKNKDSG